MRLQRLVFLGAALLSAALVSACGAKKGVVPSTSSSVLSGLNIATTIGSTVDPGPGTGLGDQNPYGLAIAPTTAGKITQGDLVICNFNNAANVQGTGTTIVGLHPVAGSLPYRIAQASSLLGCDALAIDSSDNVYAASFSSNQNPIFGAAGTLVSANASPLWSGPFGEIYSPTAGPFGSASVFASNATSGNIVRQDIKGGSVVSLEAIVTGFTPNHGVPGSLLGPSGLTYNPAGDILYVVDGNNNRLVQFKNASTIPANGITINGAGFGGPQAALARVIFAGSPLKAPISAALMFNGNVVVGNTGDNNMLEFTPQGALVATKLVDTGVAGAIFGMAATGTSLTTEKLYFNDDNTNSVVLLSQ